jgi:opacity protein-like surface antigen
MIRGNLSVSSWHKGALLVFVFIFITTLSATIQAEDRKIPSKAERTYISGGLVLNEFRSIGFDVVTSDDGSFVNNNFPMTAQTYALAFTYGSYITEHFKTELRYGRGIREDRLDKVLDINLNHWFSWYMGGTYPVTEDFSAYALYGVSFYEADMTRREDIRRSGGQDELSTFEKVQPSRTTLDDDFFKTNFSTSWMLGVDYRIQNGLYLAFEYGRLLRDTDTKFKVYQGGLHIRYEY